MENTFTYLKPKPPEEVAAAVKALSTYELSGIIWMHDGYYYSNLNQLLREEYFRRTKKQWSKERHWEMVRKRNNVWARLDAREECRSGWKQPAAKGKH